MAENYQEPSGEPLPLPPSGDEEFPYPRKKKRRGRKKSEPRIETEEGQEQQEEGPEPSSAQVVTEKELEAIVISSMQLCAMLLDESYAVVDKNGKPLPHVGVAVAQMLPWAQIYGAVLVKTFPWFGLIAGMAMLIGPALEPTTEIIMGIRKPRIMRSGPNDIYTEKYKKAKDRVIQMEREHAHEGEDNEENEKNPGKTG